MEPTTLVLTPILMAVAVCMAFGVSIATNRKLDDMRKEMNRTEKELRKAEQAATVLRTILEEYGLIRTTFRPWPVPCREVTKAHDWKFDDYAGYAQMICMWVADRLGYDIKIIPWPDDKPGKWLVTNKRPTAEPPTQEGPEKPTEAPPQKLLVPTDTKIIKQWEKYYGCKPPLFAIAVCLERAVGIELARSVLKDVQFEKALEVAQRLMAERHLKR